MAHVRSDEDRPLIDRGVSSLHKWLCPLWSLPIWDGLEPLIAARSHSETAAWCYVRLRDTVLLNGHTIRALINRSYHWPHWHNFCHQKPINVYPTIQYPESSPGPTIKQWSSWSLISHEWFTNSLWWGASTTSRYRLSPPSAIYNDTTLNVWRLLGSCSLLISGPASHFFTSHLSSPDSYQGEIWLMGCKSLILGTLEHYRDTELHHAIVFASFSIMVIISVKNNPGLH